MTFPAFQNQWASSHAVKETEPDWEAVAEFALERHPNGSPHPNGGTYTWAPNLAQLLKRYWSASGSDSIQRVKAEWLAEQANAKVKKPEYVAPSPTGKLPKGEPWCCPVCLRSDRPKAKDASMCERCKPMVMPTKLGSPVGEKMCAAANDVLATIRLQMNESKASAETQIRWAMSLHKAMPEHCGGHPMVWEGKWEYVAGRKVRVQMVCGKCKHAEFKALEVRER